MSKAQYDIYRQKVLALAKTLVVKNMYTAQAINRYLSELGKTVNENDPRSWKYYLHLAGEYHSTDKPMSVTSLDTLEPIDFTRANLRQHLATAREYAQGGTFYKALVTLHPDQEDLIKGILNPVDIDTAIAAEDGQILYYDPTLVESNEENLIPRLEWWCKVFHRRWFNSAYTLSDELYLPCHLAQMYMLIPAVVANIRLANCHTNYAHSYHIREYLASHGKLDWSVDYLNKKQMLWLYRNIRYIERNGGKRSTFEDLMQNIMTERNLPLAEWNMRHSLTEMPEEILPRVEFVRTTLNMDLAMAGEDVRNVTEMMEAEIGVAKGNERVLEDQIPIVREQLEYSKDDRLATKILESAVLDLSDAAHYTLADTLLHHWLYLSQVGTYTAVISIDNPRTGAPLTLSVKEAFITFLYAYNKAIGVELIELPVIQALNVRRRPTPLRSELEGMIDKSLLDPYVMDAIYRDLPVVGLHISTEAFNRDITAVHKKLMEHRFIWTTREHALERGMVEAAAMRLYHDVTCNLGAGTTYTQWFQERGLDMPQFSRLEAALLADTLVEYCTGANLTTTLSLREIQTAMLRLMTQLSSYSVQYLQSINIQPIIVPDTPMPRIGHQYLSSGDDIEVNSVPIYVQSLDSRGGNDEEVPGMGVLDDYDAKLKGDAEVGLSTSSEPTIRPKYFMRVEMHDMRVLGLLEPPMELDGVVDQDTDHYIPVGRLPFTDAFTDLQTPHYALDAEDLQTLLDRWNARTPDEPDVLIVDGMVYPQFLPAQTTLDIYANPLLPPVYIDGLEFNPPAMDFEGDGLPLPDRSVFFDGLHNGADALIVDGMEYPAPVYIGDGLPFPDRQVYFNALTGPNAALVIDALTYPPAVIEGDGLSLPDRSVTFLGLVSPLAAVVVDALSYPTVTFEGDGLVAP